MLIDALQCGDFDRDALVGLRAGGLSAVTVTCGFWEDTVETMDMIAAWRDLVRANSDVAAIALTSRDIEQTDKDGKLAIVLGSQNSDLLNGRIRFLELFADMGLRVMQLTYNNQNSLAASCYEESDSGLGRFGREVIWEMNQLGMLVDLSHVGNRSTLEAIRHSRKPVAITHANADSLIPHKRNKTDDVLHALRDNGGVIGCASYRNITGDYYCASIENWCEMVAKTVDIIGIDHVGIGTDRSHNHVEKHYDWMRMGRWTRHMDYGAGAFGKPGKVPPADWFNDNASIGKIPTGLATVGFSKEEIDKITHGNWLRLYRETFDA
jgi:microsomal dipeptidase-like Zn-dependent dipeptidase